MATFRVMDDAVSEVWERFSPPPIDVRKRGVSVFAPAMMEVCCVVSKSWSGVSTANQLSNSTEPIEKPLPGMTRSANKATALCNAVIRVPLAIGVAILPERSRTSSTAAGETATPLPVSGTVTEGFAGSLLVIVNVLLAAPSAVGAKTTVNDCDMAAGIVALMGGFATGRVVGLPVVSKNAAPVTVSVADRSSHGPAFETLTAIPA